MANTGKPNYTAVAGVKVGDPATMRYVTDTTAMVVTKVTRTSVTCMRVETEAEEKDMAADEGAWGLRPTKAKGILDKPVAGTEMTFRWSTKRSRFMHDGLALTLGHSVTYRDWRD